MNVHVRNLSVLYIVFGALFLIGGGLFLLLALGAGEAADAEGSEVVGGVVGTAIATVALLTGLPCLIGGIGLRNGQPWARTLVLVLGFISLLNAPLGTILGIYTIWALMFNEDVKRSFDAGPATRA